MDMFAKYNNLYWLVELNHDPAVHGILVQLPLPAHIDEQLILDAILPEKGRFS